MRVWLALGVLTGCGRIAFDAMSDANRSDSMQADVFVPTCSAGFGPWGTPVKLTSVSSNSDDESPTLSADGLELIFQRQVGATFDQDLWVATRTDPSQPFGAPTLLGFNTTDAEVDPHLMPDGLTMYLSVNPGTLQTLMMTTRTARGAAWAAPVAVADFTGQHVSGVTVSADGTEMFYSDEMVSLIKRAVWDGAHWTSLGTVTELGTMRPGFPSLSLDGRSLYFQHDTGDGSTDLYGVERTGVGALWTNEQALTDFDAANVDDGDANISPDGLHFDFASMRGNTNFDLYESSRSCL